MKILAIDIGTGTQDILLFDTAVEVENCRQMIMTSPTFIVAHEIWDASERGEDILLTGTTMGGGPCSWAAEDHLRQGRRLFATPSAAKTFNDDLVEVEKIGVVVVDETEAGRLEGVRRIEMRDVDLDAIRRAFAAFGTDLNFDALAVAVFDHGNAPPGYSDRLFRFEFLAERIREMNSPAAFAFMGDQIPPRLTRMQAVMDSVASEAVPVLVMDTAPAAVLGALEDERVSAHPTQIIVNVGNFHTLAFRFTDHVITGVFEHHTGELRPEQLGQFIRELAQGTLTHDAVFGSKGHGAWLQDSSPISLDFLAVLGPRRRMLTAASVQPYYATPFGDMMLAGCYGLVRAYGELNPESAEEIDQRFKAAKQIV